MNNNQSSKIVIFVLSVLVLLTLTLWAAEPWKDKKYTEWSEKEAEQILERSPWATAVTIPTGMSSTSDRGQGSGAGGRGSSQQPGDDMNMIDFTVAWYSSAPVREAHARLALMHAKASEDQIRQFLQPVSNVCLITVTGPYQRILMAENKDEMMKKAYLQVKGKEKVFATDYTPPSPQSRLAIFQFPRSLDGAPLLAEADKDVEFVAPLKSFSIRAHFTPKRMIYNDALSY